MTVAAMLDAGLPFDHLQEQLQKLPIGHFHVYQHRIERSMISAVQFKVHAADHHHEHSHGEHSHDEHHHGHSHGHSHEHSHDHGHSHHHHDHSHSHDHSHHHHAAIESTEEQHVHTHGLSYQEIVELFTNSALSENTKRYALAIFKEIAIAEAKVHNMSLETVHFHEVGAIDSIVDIAAVAVGLDYFNIERCYARTVPLGAGGMVRTAHGVMPIPTPATLEILKGCPTELGVVSAELTTPTGAGIIKACSNGLLPQHLHLDVKAVGFGGGTKEFQEVPNLLRIVIAETSEAAQSANRYFPERDTVVQLTTSIDDMTGQQLAYVQELLLQRGALDAYYRPILMKKGRPAQELLIMTSEERLESVLEVVARETTTIGIRVERLERRLAQRESVESDIPRVGSVKSKRVNSGAGQERIEIEFEEVKRIAHENGLTLREVYRLLGVSKQL